MQPLSQAPPEPARGRGKEIFFALVCPVLLLLAALLCYSNTFSAPFVHDDIINIVENQSIRRPGSLDAVLNPSKGTGVVNRPLINATLAANYALTGLNPVSYHALNLGIHILCALLLFGLLRITFASPAMAPAFASHARALAFTAALLWVVHPLNTQDVTYVIQRAESLASLFYLLTLYCAARGFFSPRPLAWHAASILAFLAGIQAKEILASAPFVIILYDVTFSGRGAASSLRRSRLLYLGLLCGLGLLFFQILSQIGLVAVTQAKSNYFTRWEYLISQPHALFRYLALAVLPLRLTFDYGARADTLSQAAPFLAGILGLLALTAYGLWRRNPAAFAMACFFLILAPSSSLVPLNTLVSEHRMYLPLAALLALAVGTAFRATLALPAGAGGKARVALLLLAVPAVLGLADLTIKRNRVYQSAETLWRDTLAKAPQNARAHDNLGNIALAAGDVPNAFRHFQEAVRLDPDVPFYSFNLANCHISRQEPEKAIPYYRQALELWPGMSRARMNLAVALAMTGDYAASAREFAALLAGKAGTQEDRAELARIASCPDEVGALLAALRRIGRWPDACFMLGGTLVNSGRWEAGLAYLARAGALAPNDRTLQDKLAAIETNVRLQAQGAAAIASQKLADDRGNPAPLVTIAAWYSAVGDLDRAEQALRLALDQKPDLPDAKNDLALLYLKKSRQKNPSERQALLEAAQTILASVLSSHPESLAAHYNRACVLAQTGEPQAALAELRQALSLGFSDAFSLLTDPDLSPLAGDPGFADLVRQASARRNQGK